jgi:signal transduction histidine kinase
MVGQSKPTDLAVSGVALGGEGEDVMSTVMTLLDGWEPSPHAARAHAMKNCVSVIVALCRLAEREVAGVNRERWTHVQSAARRMRDLLAEDLAAESGRDATQLRVETNACGVEELVKSVAERLEARAEEAGVKLTIDCGGGAIQGQEAGLGEALFNLVANAIEATPRGGAVSLETRPLPNGDQRWVLRDTGYGIADDQLGRLGLRYRSRKKGGSGLGFAIARAAIARHGGLLRIESRRGSGTSITVLLANGVGECVA